MWNGSKTKGERNQAAQSIIMSSATGLANVVAVIVTFFLTPLAYDVTGVWVRQFTAAHYAPDLVGLVDFLWGVLLVAVIFFVSRMTTGTLIIMGAITFIARFMAG
ncbi:hypothetical protein [Roseibium sp.]|uniref:hypothetical protein n=1 Tax=Roseibium sp. TaxID=1936156 RepID=UPI003A978924